MCVVKTPKVPTRSEAETRPQVLRNPYLDGLGPDAAARRAGRSSLRIDRGSGTAARFLQVPTRRQPAPVASNPSNRFPTVPGQIRFGGGGSGRNGYVSRLLIDSR